MVIYFDSQSATSEMVLFPLIFKQPPPPPRDIIKNCVFEFQTLYFIAFMIKHKVKTEQKEFLRIFFKSLQPKVRVQIWLLMSPPQTN